MPYKLKVKKPKYAYWKVKGANLAEIDANFSKYGPPDDRGKKFAAITETKLSIPERKGAGKTKIDGKVKHDASAGTYEVEVMYESLPCLLENTITLPKLGGQKLSMWALVEWARFFAAVVHHENEHCKKAEVEAKKILKEIEKIRGYGFATTEAEAVKLAERDLQDQVEVEFGYDRLQKRLNKIHLDFDKSSKHGANKGARLDTSVA